MRQKIVITDLTRMFLDRVCVAGIDRQWNCVRAEIQDGIHEYMLYRDYQPVIRPRAVVELELSPMRNLTRPHIEDHRWTANSDITLDYLLDDERWHNLLERTAYQRVEDVFGIDHLHIRRNIKVGTGERSLGTLRPRTIERLHVREHPRRQFQYQSRLVFTDITRRDFDAPINDLNLLHYVDWLHWVEGLSLEAIGEQLTQVLQSYDTWLRIGLTRAYEGWCWLQVSGVYTFPDYLNGQCYANFVGW